MSSHTYTYNFDETPITDGMGSYLATGLIEVTAKTGRGDADCGEPRMIVYDIEMVSITGEMLDEETEEMMPIRASLHGQLFDTIRDDIIEEILDTL
jgi:hypothetical protein